MVPQGAGTAPPGLGKTAPPPPRAFPHPARQPRLVTGMSSGRSVLNCNHANRLYIPFLNPCNGKKMQMKVSRYCDWIESFFNRQSSEARPLNPSHATIPGPRSPATVALSEPLSGQCSSSQPPAPPPWNPPAMKAGWCQHGVRLYPTEGAARPQKASDRS